ncbi:MAG: hypothetical protein CO186_08740 [Zetaproteobacteria bacterium CG_4_9_14_3_um_filter_49_83]|nr:MAG: hypothetical protein AUJ56_04285 [Zetaproteobacteria bacterium CG1_02_49_23]PIQ31629.1 MAG: hypothetical protein COW62_09085 [Zetaproteobacteria bacterium CG17_big_fil_post_rev_8_21_14_2_50_50_13]PIV30038.1 MAG: hypothetical protein COS35_08740 [Zetaproteobacteria bacterium CG02_land_8_20_14_3_00_50_9]PIY55495.1 MAG: hypothetical protein COZ00_08990 [Zetaproteobacteria bacterium CG_4_10_14_0_8_um_filter_49_80]PJA34851.1 MAG: hypothetical protein CO186_08740 [Zetaproteobacteria bacterium
MHQPTINSASSIKKSLILPIPYLLCLTGFVLPFSIAASNVLLGMALLLSIVTAHWWLGARSLWQQHRSLITVWLVYMALLVLGMAWSSDMARGLVILSKQWSWLILPVFFIAFSQNIWRERLFYSVSAGLTLHLFLCVAQSQGVPLPVAAPGGSSADDPSGLIGHIGFGLIYGMWAAWLIHYGWLQQHWRRYLPWALAVFAIIMIFTVQGRSGYLVTLALLALLIWKLGIQSISLRIRLIISIVAITILAAAWISNVFPGKDRITETMQSVEAFSQGDFQHAEVRWSIWYAAWESWKQAPVLGVGTGGFPLAAHQVQLQHPSLVYEGVAYPAHPHNMYLMDLARWGPVGLILLLLLFWFWFHTDRNRGWAYQHGCLVSISAMALFVHGFSAPSLEEYYGSIYAAIYLAVGLAAYQSNVSGSANNAA